MAYDDISTETKIRAVKEAWRTDNISRTADKFDVSRDSIYYWIEIAEEALEERFKASTPGRKDVSLAEENEILREQLQMLSEAYHKIVREFDSVDPLSQPPAFCPECGSNNIRKNGKVHTKSHGLRQRYTCGECSHSVYRALKKNSEEKQG